MVAQKSIPNVQLLMKATGEGSRGGKVVRRTKTGKAVYESAAKKHAETASKMMHNWHNNAERSGDPEHHAIAAKQALHSAYYHHHAGDEISAHDAMGYADHHRAQYEKQGHKSRTTTAVEKLHGSTAHEIDHAPYSPEEHGMPSEHPEAHADRDTQRHAKSKTESGLSNLETARNASVSAHSATAQAKRDGSSTSHADASEAHSHAATMHTHARNIGAVTHHGKMARMHSEMSHAGKENVKKAITPGNSNGENIMKNEIADIMKGEPGAGATAITRCVHCTQPLTRADLQKGQTSDLMKGLPPHFVVDDNDQPHDGDEHGHVEPSRGVPGAKENDEIAPLLKGMKGPEHGENEEYPIKKSEMDEMGMNTEGLEAKSWYVISKSEMKKLGLGDQVAFLADRKTSVAKSTTPEVRKPKLGKEQEQISKADSALQLAKQGANGGGLNGHNGRPLTEWVNTGSDQAIADYIAKSGGSGYGAGTDESIKTRGNGE